MQIGINSHNANRHPTTNIPYGIIRADYIDSDLWDQITIHNGKDLSYEADLAEHLTQKRRDFETAQSEDQVDAEEEFDEDHEREQFAETYDPYEPVYEGEHEGVRYRTTWIGGAPHLCVFESPVLTKCRPCSPCVPNAGNLENVGDYEAYGLPTSWLTTDFIEEQIEKADYAVRLGPDSKEYWNVKGNLDYLGHGPFGDKYEAAEDCYQKILQRKV